jgi:hypothetical protein
MDTATLGGIFAGIGMVITAISGVQLTRNKAQKERLKTLEEHSKRDAEALADAEAWQYHARRYFASLANFWADQGLHIPPPPAELGLPRVGSRLTAGPPPMNREPNRHRRPAERPTGPR